MRNLYKFRDKLCAELEEYSEKELTPTNLDIIDKLTHTIKNLDKVIDRCEENEYSNTYRSYPMMRNNYGMSMGGQRRDSMGRYTSDGYSRHDDMVMRLTDLMEDAPDERTRMEFQKFIQKMNTM